MSYMRIVKQKNGRVLAQKVNTRTGRVMKSTKAERAKALSEYLVKQAENVLDIGQYNKSISAGFTVKSFTFAVPTRGLLAKTRDLNDYLNRKTMMEGPSGRKLTSLHVRDQGRAKFRRDLPSRESERAKFTGNYPDYHLGVAY